MSARSSRAIATGRMFICLRVTQDPSRQQDTDSVTRRSTRFRGNARQAAGHEHDGNARSTGATTRRFCSAERSNERGRRGRKLALRSPPLLPCSSHLPPAEDSLACFLTCLPGSSPLPLLLLFPAACLRTSAPIPLAASERARLGNFTRDELRWRADGPLLRAVVSATRLGTACSDAPS